MKIMKIGDKVVCVDDSPCICGGDKKFPIIKDSVGVIRSMYVGRSGTLAIRLIGVIYTHTHKGIFCADCGMDSDRFRLLDHMKELNAAKKSDGVTSTKD